MKNSRKQSSRTPGAVAAGLMMMAVAVGCLFFAYQCVTTLDYALYKRKLPEWNVQLEQAGTAMEANIQELNRRREQNADELILLSYENLVNRDRRQYNELNRDINVAQEYVRQKELGAWALGAGAVLCLAIGVICLMPRKKAAQSQQ